MFMRVMFLKRHTDSKVQRVNNYLQVTVIGSGSLKRQSIGTRPCTWLIERTETTFLNQFA